MSLYQQIKLKQLEARKAKLELHVKLFTTLLGEIQGSIIGGKNLVEYEEDGTTLKVSDQDTLKVIKRFITKAKETLKLQPSNQVATLELEILETFLPKQLTDEELKVIILDIKSKCHTTLQSTGILGFVMKELKAKYTNQYDASKVKSLILGT